MLTTRNIKEVVQRLVWEYPSHDFWMDIEEARDAGISVEPLPQNQDYGITKAIIDYKEDFYYGFAPEVRAPRQRRAVRQTASKQTTTPPRRVNGRENGRPRKRQEAPAATV